MPKLFAIAVAVTLWSPVIITVFIPAVLHFSTAIFASSLGGSIIPTIPRKTKSFSIFSISSFDGSCSKTLYAQPNTRKASFAIFSFTSSILEIYLSKLSLSLFISPLN